MVTMASDASHMLEAALEQMDDIIAGSKAAAEYTNGLFDIGAPVYLGSLQVLQLTEELRIALELLTSEGEKESLRTQISGDTAQYLKDWLETGTANLRSSVSSETYQERLARLEADKESLVLQVSVLTDQVEAQGEKIRDLESSLDEHHHKRQTTQEMLQQELLSRTYLETQKLDLIDEVSHLKLKLVGMEKEQNDCDEKQHKAESVVNLISELQEQMCRFQQEISARIQEKKEQESKAKDPLQNRTGTSLASPSRDEQSCHCRGENGLVQELKLLKNKVDELEGEKSQYERKLKATKAEIADLQKLLATKDAEIERLRTQLSCRTPVASDSTDREEVFRRRLKEKHQELQRLKMGMESLLAANEEKDRRINELTILLNEYRKMKDAMAVAQGSCERILSVSSEEELIGSMDTRNPVHKTNTENIRSEKSSRCSSSSLVSPSFIQNELETSCRSIHTSPEPLVSPNEDSFEDRQWAQQRMLSSSLEELQSGSLQKHIVAEPVEPVMSPENRPYVENNKYQTLPGKFSRAKHNGDNEKYKPSSVQIDNDEDEDSEFTLNRSRSASAPALGKTLKIDDATLSSSDLSPQSSGVDSGQQSPVSPENRKNPKGIKKFWGKIRRTQSGSLQAGDSGTSQFQRGGLRATAGPRLARTKETGNTKSDWNAPFSQWKMEQVCSWLEDFGLSQYVNLARQWVKTGHTLLTASPQDLEKEMGIKHPLHRKKLQLALKAFGMKQVEKSADLDHIWVTRWLDDIGLPQYKDQFNEGRVDGMMLQYLTVNDLLFLKVTSQLHHLSIKCAIHVLHVNKFNPNCLRRRPGDEHNSSPSEVVQWSNHRVMEWLRSVDLAEYAPNLRGSGVHGGLIILEPRFNSDTLAMLLNIPPQKTLLRRHLTTNFKMLIGSEAQQEKREFMESSSYAPLTTTAKVRPKKLGFSNFGHLRKKKFDDSTDYVYPMDTAQSATNGAQKGYGGHRRLSPVFGRDLHRLEQMEVTEGTVMQIGALSEGINNLTYMLSHDGFLKDFQHGQELQC
ncbi:liprin-beta-2-like isoform X5 [Acipenser ruthenus]|uniref:liprin-beta-2-like isoform X5 n=1 Tax=Acipenser ruthenus TaxID=7906 RepID=UPI0027414FA3|nr:liprin-beta-2-like isoform X5 [Acipenser ruthenus]